MRRSAKPYVLELSARSEESLACVRMMRLGVDRVIVRQTHWLTVTVVQIDRLNFPFLFSLKMEPSFTQRVRARLASPKTHVVSEFTSPWPLIRSNSLTLPCTSSTGSGSCLMEVAECFQAPQVLRRYSGMWWMVMWQRNILLLLLLLLLAHTAYTDNTTKRYVECW